MAYQKWKLPRVRYGKLRALIRLNGPLTTPRFYSSAKLLKPQPQVHVHSLTRLLVYSFTARCDPAVPANALSRIGKYPQWIGAQPCLVVTALGWRQRLNTGLRAAPCSVAVILDLKSKTRLEWTVSVPCPSFCMGSKGKVHQRNVCFVVLRSTVQ
jgi:hypothetical protein